MTFELLWTDQCFLIVLAFSFAAIGISLRKKHTRYAFFQLFKKPIAASASIILLFFLLIGILDSIHYKTANEYQPQSILDRILAPLNTHHEKTYSAPLALTLYTTETILADGQARQVYPRLTYPSKQFKTTKDVKFWLEKVFIKSIKVFHFN